MMEPSGTTFVAHAAWMGRHGEGEGVSAMCADESMALMRGQLREYV